MIPKTGTAKLIKLVAHLTMAEPKALMSIGNGTRLGYV
jgi:hypothetical protein